MIKIEKQLIIVYCGDVSNKSEYIEHEKQYAVVAYKTVLKKDRDKNTFEVLYLGVIGSGNRLVFIPEFNCKVFVIPDSK